MLYTNMHRLRGEIGASDILSKDKKNTIKYTQHALLSENALLKEVARLDVENKVT